MAYLLFPGRHLLNTKFQETYLWDILRLPVGKLDLVGQTSISSEERITHIIFAVTSSNQSNSRYNPIPFFERAITLDRFAHQYKEALDISYQIIGIPHFNPTDNFASYILKELQEQEEDIVRLDPSNTIVLCSTHALIKQYKDLGFAILPAEYDLEKNEYTKETPISTLKKFVNIGENWKQDNTLTDFMSKATREVWTDFPTIPRNILRLWNDPLLTESGSLTIDRNYSTYAIGMGHQVLLDMKYKDIKGAVKSGKIVDEGCADGALMVRLAEDFPDSDIVGIELTTEFTARCQERLRAGEFGGTYVHFHQRNLLEPIFDENSIDTTICNSTTHELWSYGNKEESLIGYLKNKYTQLRKGGRIVIRDVVGPENKDQEVYVSLNREDGSNDDVLKDCSSHQELQNHITNLSTYGRFVRFAQDYLVDMRNDGRRGEDTKISFREEEIDGKKYIVTTLKNIVEFMTKKDYVDNWRSELNEEFAYWSFSDWKKALSNHGFKVIENPNEKEGVSVSYRNDWIVKNRWEGKVELFKNKNGELILLEYPPTHMVLVAEK